LTTLFRSATLYVSQKEIFLEQLGDRVRTLRRARKLKQKQFAGLMGVAVATISEIESNKRMPRVDLLVKIAKFFGISVDSLLGASAGYQPSIDDIDGAHEPELPQESREAIKRYIEYITPRIASNFLHIQKSYSIDQKILELGGNSELIVKLLEMYDSQFLWRMTELPESQREILVKLISELAGAEKKNLDDKPIEHDEVSNPEHMVDSEKTDTHPDETTVDSGQDSSLAPDEKSKEL
jgi:transcriptional regulator with XRE-family HTH domain